MFTILIQKLVHWLFHCLISHEESDHWRKEYSQATGYQKQLFEQTYEQFIKTVARGNDQQLMNYLKAEEDRTHEEVESALNYLKLRKIKRMLNENHADLEKIIQKKNRKCYFALMST